MRTRSRHRRAIAVVAGALASLLVLAGCSFGGETEPDLPTQSTTPFPDEVVQQLTDAVTHAMGTTGSSGAIVGVWAPWSGSWVTGLGTQRPDGGGEVTVDQRFRGGKMTRAMTCDVLYSLVADGQVDLDDSITEYVSGVPDLEAVSLGELCDGTSGIGSYTGALYNSWISNPSRQWDPRYIASFGLGQPRTAEPGAAYRDSDAGYVLLGLALERATGATAAQLLQTHVADPLGLEATALGDMPAEGALQGGQSLPNAEGALDCAQPVDLTAASWTTGFTDAGVVTDIDDLGRYVQALASGALVSDDDRFASPLPVAPDAPSWFAAGGGAIMAGSLIGQYGKVPGYISAAFADPGSGLTVAVVLNNSAADPLVGEYLAWELAAIASKAPAAAGESVPEAGLPWTAEQYHEAIAGAAVCTPPASE
ncbi:serine hydrolase domain-containing protein [Microbacterium sp. M3]|uniref:Serine hydrolase domain-containing protein n=1 Tax=Microbacterium arthrosphaerae TaxID=792652 RepID=A0ABU4H4B5_9MICO|nr:MULTISPECIES: serine hydrolase domain-containing protein [Microbacterium]MDW4574171.1 serine hydrolase domain-containing protein [Microbacterium arthrosphaerae]MDW7608026.1 serine hydrolase domain-containing protein [Microbacterium sp. M3]